MKAKEVVPCPPTEVVRRGLDVPPLPADAALLSIDDVGGYLRRSREAVRKLLDARRETDEIGKLLRGWVVQMTDHRRYILREPFMDWYRSLIANKGKRN